MSGASQFRPHGRAALSLDVGTGLASNSNDAFYDYTSHGIALGFSIHY
jgi:hypothetical protein